jgi:hypothetical protein
MTRLRLTTVIDDAALGTFVNSRVTGSLKYFNHNGGNEGFTCTAIGCRDNGEGVVIMTNSDNGAILEEIANSVARVYKWKDYYLPEIKKVIDVDESVTAKYQGKYDLNGRKVVITKGDSCLLLNATGDLQWKIYFTSDSDFFLREVRGSLKFQADKNKMITGFSFNGVTAKKLE